MRIDSGYATAKTQENVFAFQIRKGNDIIDMSLSLLYIKNPPINSKLNGYYYVTEFADKSKRPCLDKFRPYPIQLTRRFSQKMYDHFALLAIDLKLNYVNKICKEHGYVLIDPYK